MRHLFAHALAAPVAVAACVVGLEARAAAPGPGPLVHYDFDDGDGAVAHDRTGNGLHGQIIAATSVRRGDGWAVELNRNGCVQLPKSPALDALGRPGQSYTIEFRFKSPGGRDQSLTEKWPRSSVGYPWAIRGPYPDGAVKFCIYDAKTNRAAQATYTHPATKDDKWHHLAAVRDTDKGELRLYVDGVLGRKARDVLAETDISNDGQVCIGARHYSTRVEYAGIAGQLDDVRIFARALSADEVKRHCGLTTPPTHRDVNSADVPEVFSPVDPVLTLRAAETVVKADARGAVQIDAGADSYVVESCFSYPGDDNRIGWNGLPRALDQPGYPVVEFQNGAEPLWDPSVKRLSPGTLSVDVRGRHYRLQRTIAVHPARIDFEDKVSSLGSTPVAVIVRHGITADTAFLERFNVGQEVAANPTVFLRGPRRSVGLVMNDNFSRRRIRPTLGSSLNHSGVQILRFVLDAGATKTFSWSVYIMAEGKGYFDFVNRVRGDWNANVSIEGPFSFGYLLPEADDTKLYLLLSNTSFRIKQVLRDPAEMQRMRQYFAWRGTRLLALAPWLDHEPGAMDHVVTWDEYRQIMGEVLPTLRRTVPHVRVLGCIETDWVAIRPSQIPGGEAIPLPDQTRRSGPSVIKTMTPEVSAIIENGMPGWADSIVRTAKGEVQVYHYYRGLAPINQLPLCVFPEVGNRRYEYMMQQIRLAIDELDMDGVYLDEFPLGQIGSRRAYGGGWDGMSADINSHTGRFSGPYKDCSLAGVKARVEAISYVRSRGKAFVANRHSTTRDEQSLAAFRFTETGSSVAAAGATWEVGTEPPALNYLFFSHLNTPLGLGACGSPAGDEATWMMKVAIIYLRHGMVFYHYNMKEPPMTDENMGAFDMAKRMFPITPRELGKGFLVGEERILSAVSLDRLWDKDGRPTVVLLDINGRRVNPGGRCEITPSNGRWRVRLDLNDWAEVAIVE